jgi:hypothetical protein
MINMLTVRTAVDLLSKIDVWLSENDRLYMERMLDWTRADRSPGPGYIDTMNCQRIWLLVLTYADIIGQMTRTRVMFDCPRNVRLGTHIVDVATSQVGEMGLRERTAVLRATEVRS